MIRSVAALADVVQTLRDTTLHRLNGVEVVEVDHTADPHVVRVKLKPTDAGSLAVDCYRHVNVEVGDRVDVDYSDKHRMRVRGGIGAAVWHTALLEGSWVDYASGDHPALRYRLEPGRVLRIHGAAKSGSGTIFTLPEGYRPAFASFIPAAASGASGVASVAVDGTVAAVAGTTTTVFAINCTVPLD